MIATKEITEATKQNTPDLNKSILNERKPEVFESFKSNSSDFLTLNNLAYIDPMHTQLNEIKSNTFTEKPIEASYTLFNKNFATFMKYTDSNLDINMIVSDSPTLNTKGKECESDEAKILVKEMAATSLTKTSLNSRNDNTQVSKSFDLTPLKRQNNCMNYNFNESLSATSTMLNEQKETPKTVLSTKQHEFSNKTPKLFSTTSSTGSSSTSSNFSSNSSATSSRSESNETPKFPFTQKENNKISNTKKFSSTSSASSTSSTCSSSTKSNTLKEATMLVTPFNIENELIKYTKNLKLSNKMYSDGYKLGSHIRNGGFSEIYEGNVINEIDKRVIIKLIPKRKTKNWLMVHNKKYPAEVLLHKMCNKIEGVVEMLEFFEQENDWVIIMPKVENCLDLFDYLESKQRGRLSEVEACHFFTQLVKINIDLINHGVVHRDIKSENLLVDLDTMKLILIDFGASAICRNKTNAPGAHAQQHNYTDFHGTRQYKPPEYITHKKYAAQASTIWTLGILLFDMCNGQLPFETEQEITEYNLQMKAPVSDEYKLLLYACLNVDPTKRPSLSELLEFPWCVNNLKVDFRDHL